ncbi:MAG: ketoisovalerate oxidoreductase, partial [Hyphomicrobiales bacterium]|nr:ketoisovalerate oxidoreductase [Hyphomicrobiales bacterium]
YGRGGQGAVLASKMLAKALVMGGQHVTAIPAFGFERRGAPVAAFLRYSEQPIRAATNIYNPDYIICIDPTVANAVDIFAGVVPGGTLVQNTRQPIKNLYIPDQIDCVVTCDAVGIGMEIFNKQITNTIMLGAFAKATGIISMDALKSGLKSANFRDAGLEQNMIAMKRGYDESQIMHRQKNNPGGGWL